MWVNFALVLVKKKDNMKQCISNKGFEEAAVEVKERKREREREKKKSWTLDIVSLNPI